MPKAKRKGRPQTNFETMLARLPKGTLAEIDSVLDAKERETRADFVRRAIEWLVSRRRNKELASKGAAL